jgi:diguanylate cyclase (GGDEF)-like protein
MAFKDSLTKINNRRAFMSEWDHLRAEAARAEHCVLLIDADNFKAINDQHGHDVGDQVLQALAHTIRDTEGVESCGRIGGEEFAVICRGTSTRGAQVASDIVQRVSGLRVQGVCFSVSIGLAPEAQTESAIAAMKRADEALYQAKRQGKNGYSVQPKV